MCACVRVCVCALYRDFKMQPTQVGKTSVWGGGGECPSAPTTQVASSSNVRVRAATRDKADLCGYQQGVLKHSIAIYNSLVLSTFSLHFRIAVIYTAQALSCVNPIQKQIPTQVRVRATCI